MILVVEHATDLQPIPQEPRRCSLEQALRNMGWPYPEATAAMHAATLPVRRPFPTAARPAATPTPLPVRKPVPVRPKSPVLAPARTVAGAPLPMLAFAASG